MLDERTGSDTDVPAPPAALVALLPAPMLERFGRLIRSMSVSLVTSVLSLTMLAVLVHLSSVSPAWANVVASLAAVGPSFALNRRYAWRCTGRGHARKELAAHSGCTRCAAWPRRRRPSTSPVAGPTAPGCSPTTRTVMLLGANIAMSMALWVGQFALLERTLVVVRRAEA